MTRIPIRFSLTASILLLVVLLTAAVLVANVIAGRRIADDLSSKYLDATERVVEERLHAFLQPVASGLESSRAWTGRGLLDPRDVEGANALYVPILREHRQITSLATGDEAGYSYRVGAEGEGFKNRITHGDVDGRDADFLLLDAKGDMEWTWTEATDYDARTRPWYTVARQELDRAGSAAASSIAWTDPFILRTSKNPGVAASVPCQGKDGTVFVLTFNVMLTKLSDFTSSLRPTPRGFALLLTDKGEVVGFPADDRFPTSESRLAFVKELGNRMPALDELGIPVLDASACIGPEVIAAGVARRIRCEAAGEAWRTSFRPYPIGEEKRVWIGVAVPEADFLAQVAEQRKNILIVSLIALAAAAILGMGLARLFGRPLLQLAEQSERITTLDLTPGAPIHTHVAETWRLAEAQERMRVALDSFGRYVPTPVVRELLKQGSAAQLGGKVCPLTVMFSDVRDFTTISEGLEPDALIRHLAEYFESLMTIVEEHGGAVDKIIGDAIMSLWGAPVAFEDHAQRAVRAALLSDAWIRGHEARCREQSLPVLATGFGLAGGEAFVGNVGSHDRLNYTALGDVVNLSARLEGVCKIYGTRILCDETVRRESGDGFAWRWVGVVAVKGKNEPIRIHEPLGLVGEVAEERLRFAAQYEKALGTFLERRFEEAIALLDDLGGEHASDRSVARLREECVDLRAAPPPPAWDGVLRLKTK